MAISFVGQCHLLGVSLLILATFTQLTSQTTPNTVNMLEDTLDFLSRGYDPTSQLLDDLYYANRKSTWKLPIFAKNKPNDLHDPATKQDLKIPPFFKASLHSNVVYSATIYQTLADLLPLMSLNPAKARMDSSSFEYQLNGTVNSTVDQVGCESIIEFREIDLTNQASDSDSTQFDPKFIETFTKLLDNGKPNDTELTQYFDFISKYGLYYFTDASLGGVSVQQWIIPLPLSKEKSQLEEDLKTQLKAHWIDDKVTVPSSVNGADYFYENFGGFTNISKLIDFHKSIKFNRTLTTGTLKRITDLSYLQKQYNGKNQFKILVENLKKTEDRLAAQYVIKRWKEGMKTAEDSWFSSTAVGLNNSKVMSKFLKELEEKKHLAVSDPIFQLVTEMAHYPVNYLIAMNGSLKK